MNNQYHDTSKILMELSLANLAPAFKQGMTNVKNTIGQKAGAVAGAVGRAGSAVKQAAVNTATKAGGAISQAGANTAAAAARAKEAATNAMNKTREVARDTAQKAREAAKDAADRARNATKQAVEKAKPVVQQAGKTALKVAKNTAIGTGAVGAGGVYLAAKD